MDPQPAPNGTRPLELFSLAISIFSVSFIAAQSYFSAKERNKAYEQMSSEHLRRR